MKKVRRFFKYVMHYSYLLAVLLINPLINVSFGYAIAGVLLGYVGIVVIFDVKSDYTFWGKLINFIILLTPAILAFTAYSLADRLLVEGSGGKFVVSAILLLMAYLGHMMREDSIINDNILGKICSIFPYVIGVCGAAIAVTETGLFVNANEQILLYSSIVLFVAVAMGVYCVTESHIASARWRRERGIE